MAAQAIWWDDKRQAYVCKAEASIAADVVTYATNRNNGPEIGVGTQLLCLETGGVYFYDGAAFERFGT